MARHRQKTLTTKKDNKMKRTVSFSQTPASILHRRCAAARRQISEPLNGPAPARFSKASPRSRGCLAWGLGLALCAPAAMGQNDTVGWSAISGGGGVSTGGIFQVSSTIGQAEASSASGGGFSVTGGFWSIYSVVPLPGGPGLTLARLGGNVVLSWPSLPTGFHLEQTPTLTGPSWTTVTNAPVDNGVTKSVTLPLQAGSHFFRLRAP
jgi:hypothetical protein